MGLPINKLICASNENKVLFDFFRTGTYDRKRDFILTTSPSMDILISSNLERLIYRLTGEDAQKCAELMQALSDGGEYTITEDMKKVLLISMVITAVKRKQMKLFMQHTRAVIM